MTGIKNFKYKAKDKDGKDVSDVIKAHSIKDATLKLQNNGYYPVSIEIAERGSIVKFSNLLQFNKVSKHDVVIFTRRLSDLLNGGINLTRALNILSIQTENGDFRKHIKNIKDAVEKGVLFSDALDTKEHKNIFSELYIELTRASEKSGVLETALNHLADFSEKEIETRNKIYSELTYPVIMLFVGFVSVLFLLLFVLPKFQMMFEDMNSMLPVSTKILVALSNFLRGYPYLYLPLISCILIFFWYFNKRESGRLFFSKIKLKLPVIGNFMRKTLVARFLRMLSVMLTNGVPILSALVIARNSINNKVFTGEIEKILKSVKEGKGIRKPIMEIEFFPPMVSDMIAVGEEIGRLEEALVKTANIYEKEVEYSLKTLTKVLEPVIMLVIGAFICFIAIALLLPIFQMRMSIG